MSSLNYWSYVSNFWLRSLNNWSMDNWDWSSSLLDASLDGLRNNSTAAASSSPFRFWSHEHLFKHLLGSHGLSNWIQVEELPSHEHNSREHGAEENHDTNEGVSCLFSFFWAHII